MRWKCFGSLVALLTALIPLTAAARYDVSFSKRGGFSDRLVTGGFQPRAWMITADSALLMKWVDEREIAWIDPGVSNVQSSVDAASWTDSSNQRERGFFVRGDRLEMLPLDNGAAGTIVQLPVAPVAFYPTPNIRALTYNDVGTQRISVAARMIDGKVCIWEGTFSSFSSAPFCSATNAISGNDITGGVLSNVPVFFFSGANYLGRLSRTGASTYSFTNLGLPGGVGSIYPSVAATPSVIDTSKLEVAFVSASNAYTARVNATGSATWTTLAALPVGYATSNSSVSVGLQRYQTYTVFPITTTQRMTFYLKPTVYDVLTLGATSSGWGASWSVRDPPGDQGWYGILGTVEYPSGSVNTTLGSAFGSMGSFALFYSAYHLGELANDAFSDHVVYQPPPTAEVLGLGRTDPGSGTTGTFSANESSASVWTIAGIASAIRRNGDPPWEVVVSDTTNFGFSWDTDSVVSPLPSVALMPTGLPDSLSDPYTGISPHGGNLYHLSLQIPISGTAANCPVQNQRQLVARRGASAEDIAALTLASSDLVVAATGNLDHGGLVVTGGPSSEVAHLIWWDMSAAQVRYSRWSGASLSTPTALALPALPPGLVRAPGDVVYAWSGVTAFPTMCRVWPTVGTCGTMAMTPPPSKPNIYFGDIGPLDTTLKRTCPSGAGFQRCFDTDQPVAFAASQLVTNRVYAVWQGDDLIAPGSATSIYFAYSTNADFTSWTSPVRVHSRTDDNLYYIEPSITVASDDSLIVTYSTIYNNHSSPTGTGRLVYSFNYGVTFAEAALPSPPTWSPQDLDLHCVRQKVFLGEYREGSSVGLKVYNTFHYSRANEVTQLGLWSSRRSLF